MGDTSASLPIGRQVALPGHLDGFVALGSARLLAKGFECRVRLPDSTLDESVLSDEEAAVLAGTTPDASANMPLANVDQLRLLVESTRIRLAFLSEAQPNRGQLRLVEQAPAGPALKGGDWGGISPTAELLALGKPTANWQSLIENAALTTREREEGKAGQKQWI